MQRVSSSVGLLRGLAPRRARAARVLPGFGLSLGVTLSYLALFVLIPLAALVARTFTLSWSRFVALATSPRAIALYELTIGTSAIAALVNAVFGLLVAWVLVRYRFPGRRVIDAIVDLPFALPTAVAGITLTSLYSTTGGRADPRATGAFPSRSRRSGSSSHSSSSACRSWSERCSRCCRTWIQRWRKRRSASARAARSCSLA